MGKRCCALRCRLGHKGVDMKGITMHNYAMDRNNSTRWRVEYH